MDNTWMLFTTLLPQWLRDSLEQIPEAASELRQLRLRLGQVPLGDFPDGRRELSQRKAVPEDLDCVLGRASGYGAYSSLGLHQGYITASGGHRVGVCGTAVVKDGQVTGMRSITSLCIRVARDYPGCGEGLVEKLCGSALLLGAPGSGKTTLLRDLSRQLGKSESVTVVDERGELFPQGMDAQGVDVLAGCPKAKGLDMLLRTMCPQTIALDEITRPEDCRSLLDAAGCGVRLLATAHGRTRQDLQRRPVYRQLLEAELFDQLVLVRRPGVYELEGMVQ